MEIGMELRKDIDEVMERVKRFSTSDKAGDALVLINLKQDDYKIKGLDEWQFPEDMEAFLDETIKAFEHKWAGRRAIEDDFIPAMNAWYGIAEHSAFVGGEVHFSSDTSYPHPAIEDFSQAKNLTFSEDSEWLKMVVDGLSYLKEKGEGKFAIKLRGAMSPLDLANALRGNDLFTDFYTDPEALHEFLEFCTKACEFYMAKQKEVIGDFYGGVLCNDLWLPGNSIGHLSEDTSVMCSPATYTEFGQPYTSQLVEPYDHSFMHLHTAGVHAYEEILKVPTLDFFELAPDPNQPRGIQVYKDNIHLFGNKVMKLFVTFDEIKDNIEFLKTAKAVLLCDAESIEEANEIVSYVRRELPVHKE